METEMGKKNQMYRYFKGKTDEITHEKAWTWLRKGNLKRETESFLIAAQNNVTRTSYVEMKIDNAQQNSKSRLGGEKDETANYIISGWSKLAQ